MSGSGLVFITMERIEILDNVKLVLKHLGLAEAVELTRVERDRVYGWPAGSGLMEHVLRERWYPDLKQSTEHFHGSGGVSFREPASPSLQVVFYWDQAGRCYVEMDLDFHWGGPGHWWEVGRNWMTGKVTDQRHMAQALQRRFTQEKS